MDLVSGNSIGRSQIPEVIIWLHDFHLSLTAPLHFVIPIIKLRLQSEIPPTCRETTEGKQVYIVL